MVWVCEYSAKQNAFHVETLDNIVKINRQTILQGENPGYIPVEVSETREEAIKFADCWRMKLNNQTSL